MKGNTFEVRITNHYFESVAKQKLAAHEAIGEPIDNALSNAKKGEQALVLLSIDRYEKNSDLIRITVADWGRGMSAKELENALQFGSEHSDEGYLCIYGVGLCNFLLSMSQHKHEWTVGSKKPGDKMYNIVVGPFATKMERHSGPMPFYDLVMRKKLEMYGDPSTVVSVVTNKRVASTMLSSKGNCAPSKVSTLNVLRRAMAEHLGVKYRGFLEADKKTGEAPARIMIADFCHKNKRKEDVFVRPLFQPYSERHVFKTNVAIGAYKLPVEVEYGLLAKQQTSELVMGEYEARYYYQNNSETQGFDIQLGRRMVATAQMESIWGKKPHPTFNAWTGCVKVDVEGAKLPRGFLNTLSNKSDIDISDIGWQKIFEMIRQNPQMKPYAMPVATLELYREAKADALRNLYPSHDVKVQPPVFASRVLVDVVDIAPDKTCSVYCLTKKAGSADDLGKLLMYWNGMLDQGYQPTCGYLICKECGPMLKETCEALIRATSVNGKPTYNFQIMVDPNLPD